MPHRQFSRFNTNIPATLVIEGMMGSHKYYLNDASQGGLSFNAMACIKKGTHLQVSFSDKHGPDKQGSDKHYTKEAQIAWCNPLEHCQCQLGLSFDKRMKKSSLDKIVVIK